MKMPVGTCRAVAENAALSKTKTGKEQIAILLRSVDDPNCSITWYGYFTEGTFERTIQSLRYLGWRGNDLYEFRNGLPSECKSEVEIVVEDERNLEDKLVRKVRWINSGGGLGVKEVLNEADARTFAATMRGRIQQLGGVTRTQPLKETKPTPQALNDAQVAREDGEPLEDTGDDDIPF